MAVEHSALTGSDLHEPKGVASANAGDVYVADGSGSGNHRDHVSTAILHVWFPKIGGGTGVDSDQYVASPVAGRITGMWSTVSKDITSAACTLTGSIGGTAINSGVITVTDSANQGDVDSASPADSSTADITVGAAIKFASNQGNDSGDSADAMITIAIDLNQ